MTLSRLCPSAFDADIIPHIGIFVNIIVNIPKRSSCHGDDAGAFRNERGEHNEAIGRVVVKVLGGEAERGELGHCPPVIVVAAIAVTEIEITDGGGVEAQSGPSGRESSIKSARRG